MTKLVFDLEHNPVPDSYVAANTAILAALAAEIQGLEDRILGLSAQRHADALARGMTELREAATQLVAAYVYPEVIRWPRRCLLRRIWASWVAFRWHGQGRLLAKTGPDLRLCVWAILGLNQ